MIPATLPAETIYPAPVPRTAEAIQNCQVRGQTLRRSDAETSYEQFRLCRSQDPADPGSAADTESWLAVAPAQPAGHYISPAFIRRFYDLDSFQLRMESLYYTVRLNSEVKADARVFVKFSRSIQWSVLFSDRFWSTNESLELFTDSAGTTFYGLGPECRQFSSSNPTRIPVDDFRTEMNHLLRNSLAPSTQKAYLHSMDIFVKFRESHGFSDVWPIPLDDLTSFIVYMFRKKLSHSTVSGYISGLSYFNKINNLEDNTQKFVVRKLIEGIKRLGGPNQKDTRLPITRDILEKLLRSLAVICKNGYETKLFMTSFSLAFHGFMRVGEITVDCKNKQMHTVKFENIKLCDARLEVLLTSSKTDQFGSGTTIVISKQKNKNVCPVQIMANFMKFAHLIWDLYFVILMDPPLQDTSFQHY
ncbi:unnamed protein product [Mytilus edulis]|uniref:Core-binding (CB) domain-containing protein n=1 Tax=Mytilus edulis TaxID=6550 RepID=A0A8S3PY77_MYTED|nr:unnamed protein product [Mytilus edulis]